MYRPQAHCKSRLSMHRPQAHYNSRVSMHRPQTHFKSRLLMHRPQTPFKSRLYMHILPTYYKLGHLYVLEKQAIDAQTTYVLQKQATYVLQKPKNHKLTDENIKFPGKITTVTYLSQNEAKMNVVINDDTYHNTRRRRK